MSPGLIPSVPWAGGGDPTARVPHRLFLSMSTLTGSPPLPWTDRKQGDNSALCLFTSSSLMQESVAQRDEAPAQHPRGGPVQHVLFRNASRSSVWGTLRLCVYILTGHNKAPHRKGGCALAKKPQ